MTDSNTLAILDALRANFAGKLPERTRQIRAVVAGLEHTLSPESLEEARRYAHRLAGSAGSFGFPEVGEAAAELEAALREPSGSWPRLASAMARLERLTLV